MKKAPLLVLCAVLLAKSASAQNAVPPPVTEGQIAVHEINVDQAAATLVETPCGAIMIDAGGRTDADAEHLMGYLEQFFSARPHLDKTLAAFYLSHDHIDHDYSLMRVANAYKIKAFIYNGHVGKGPGAPPIRQMQVFADANRIPIRTISDATLPKLRTKQFSDADIDPLNCSGVDPKVRVISGAIGANPGWSKDDFSDDNNHSLVVRIDYGRASFLFMGDMELRAQRDLIARHRTDKLLDVDVYHVAHHGAENGTDIHTMQALSPRIAVMGVGDASIEVDWTAWKHGHPRKPAVDAMLAGVSGARPSISAPVFDAQFVHTPRKIDKAIYATGWDGDVVITATADGGYSIWTSR